MVLKFLIHLLIVTGIGLFCGPVQAQEHPWMQNAGSSSFADKLLRHKQDHGWEHLRNSLFVDAKYAYKQRSSTADRLLYTFLWVDQMALGESKYVHRWIEGLKKKGLLHSNMPRQVEFTKGQLGDRLSDSFLIYFFSNTKLMKDSYNQYSSQDCLIETFRILNELYQKHGHAFRKYPNLAFAIAFVHDVPPSPLWPHPQVKQTVLPRKLRSPEDVFLHFTSSRSGKRFLTNIRTTPMRDLIFIVDLLLSDEEIKWVFSNVKETDTQFDEVYSNIRYVYQRVEDSQYVWPYKKYTMQAIMDKGGICVDQGYFASQAGKAKGMPTIEFVGAGLDGRHAWFGYRNSRGQWNMDAGRYADRRFITGLAMNPQTWGFISDHELKFINEHFHQRPSYSRSVLHESWARILNHQQEYDLAEKAAFDATRMERKNGPAWDLLIHIRKQKGASNSRVDSAYRSAITAMQGYPDLKSGFQESFASWLEQTNRKNLAKMERSKITFHNRNGRSDLAVNNAVNLLKKSKKQDSRQGQLYVFKKSVTDIGSGGGIDTYDKLLVPFVNYLLGKGLANDAKSAVIHTEKVLKPAKNSALSRDFEKLKKRVGA